MPTASEPLARTRGRALRRAVGLLGAVLLLVCAVDAMRPPPKQVTSRVLVAGVRLHRALLSPYLGRLGVRCRFSPTCSHYAEAVLKRFGTLRGGWLAVRRLLRCGPWTKRGTLDPPPQPLAPGSHPP